MGLIFQDKYLQVNTQISGVGIMNLYWSFSSSKNCVPLSFGGVTCLLNGFYTFSSYLIFKSIFFLQELNLYQKYGDKAKSGFKMTTYGKICLHNKFLMNSKCFSRFWNVLEFLPIVCNTPVDVTSKTVCIVTEQHKVGNSIIVISFILHKVSSPISGLALAHLWCSHK